MAGDWIKLRTGLHAHPKVVRMASALKADGMQTVSAKVLRHAVVGALAASWSVFDAHAIDGRLEGYTERDLDDELGWQGFAAAMSSVAWLEAAPGALIAPRFDTHNGQSAKRRAQDAERKRAVRSASAPISDTLRTREEKRRPIETHSRAITTTTAPVAAPSCVSSAVDLSAQEACVLLAAGGVHGVKPSNRRLRRLNEAGAGPEDWEAAAQICASKSKFFFAFAAGVVETRLKDRSNGRVASPQVATAWDHSRSTIEAMGERLGLGKWDVHAFERGRGESFKVYENRVRGRLAEGAAA